MHKALQLRITRIGEHFYKYGTKYKLICQPGPGSRMTSPLQV